MFPRLRDHWLTMDPRSAGLFRVTIGCVWLLHLADRWALREDFYSPRGVLPSSLLADSREIPNFPTIFTALESHAWGSGLFFGVAFLAAAALTAGLFTRGSALLSLFAFSTLAHRNPYVLIAGDYVLGSMLLWLTVLRAGKRFSVDAALRRRGRDDDFLREQTSPPRPSLAVLGLLLQLGLIYFATAWQKSGPTWWSDGTALSHMLGLHRFLRPGAALVSSLPDSGLVWLTHGVLLFEFLVLPLILLPFARPWLRRVTWLGLIALHGGISCVLDTGSFSITMLACLPLLLSTADWEWIERLVAVQTFGSAPARRSFGLRWSRFLSCGRANDSLADNNFEVDGRHLEAAPKFQSSVKPEHSQSGRHRTAVRTATTSWCGITSVASELVSAWLLLGMLCSNYSLNFAMERREAPRSWLDLPQRFAAAHQRWDMFAPDAPKFDPQLLVRVRLRDGRLLSLQSDDLHSDAELPSAGIDLAPRLAPFTWRIYIGHAILQLNPARQAESDALRQVLCRRFLRELRTLGRPLHNIHAIELWSRAVPTNRRAAELSALEPVHVSSLLLSEEGRRE